jgi:hypothetical protein
MIGERWNNLGPEDKAVRVDKIFNIHYAEPAAIGHAIYMSFLILTGISGISRKRRTG